MASGRGERRRKKDVERCLVTPIPAATRALGEERKRERDTLHVEGKGGGEKKLGVIKKELSADATTIVHASE